MPQLQKKLRVAMPAWEIGRVNSGLGAKVGGLGVVVEELPPELVKAAAKQNIDLEIEILSPCFAYHNRKKMTKLDVHVPVTLDEHTFEFEVYEHTFPDGQKVVYFWDSWQLGWTTPSAIYPSDALFGLRLYAAVSQAMAGYIKQRDFQTIHLHDYHVGLIPFYLGDNYVHDVPVHFTIHNATYQGLTPVKGKGPQLLAELNLSDEHLYEKYFSFFHDQLNMMKACLLKVHETGGRVTTVSGDVAGTWGYAAELRQNQQQILAKAQAQKGSPPGEVFVPNGYLDLFEKLPISGITNGMSAQNRPENLLELKASVLQRIQDIQGKDPIFEHPTVQMGMLGQDHNFDAKTLPVKAELKRLLHLETFGSEPENDPILITAVGRLVEQKNLGLVTDILERTLRYDGGAKFIILASAPSGDAAGKAIEHRFIQLAAKYPQHIYFNNGFNLPLSKLIFAGGDFSLIPSRFEPCGLVDYEASLLGNIVIGRATGGLTKVAHCGYLYEWLDIKDRAGEANAFFDQIKAAIDTYRKDPERHQELILAAMAIDASWDTSAAQYIHLYRYGLIVKRWNEERRKLLQKFITSLKEDERRLFADFFLLAHEDYEDSFDWELKRALQS